MTTSGMRCLKSSTNSSQTLKVRSDQCMPNFSYFFLDWVGVTAYPTFLRFICRTANRFFVGVPLCKPSSLIRTCIIGIAHRSECGLPRCHWRPHNRCDQLSQNYQSLPQFYETVIKISLLWPFEVTESVLQSCREMFDDGGEKNQCRLSSFGPPSRRTVNASQTGSWCAHAGMLKRGLKVMSCSNFSVERSHHLAHGDCDAWLSFWGPWYNHEDFHCQLYVDPYKLNGM